MASSAAGALLVAGCGGAGGDGIDRTKIWRLSARGRRVSRAAKSHDANKRFATPLAAALGRAHAGDTSQVVSLDTTPEIWDRLFGGASPPVADLRHLPAALRNLVP